VILLFNTFEERKKAVEKLNEIYGARSKIEHTGTTIENKMIAYDAEKYANIIFKKLIAKSEEFDCNHGNL